MATKQVINQATKLDKSITNFNDKKKVKKLASGRELKVHKVLHFTRTKGKIKSEIDNELLLLKVFSDFDQKLAMKNILIDTYEIRNPHDLYPMFCDDAARCLRIPNKGAKNSIFNEAVSVNYFAERFSAKNILLEMEVHYEYYNYKVADYVCTIYNKFRVGVSVTRAMKHKDPTSFSLSDAHELLQKKLLGLILARKCVSKEHDFNICFLHIWCQTPEIADKLNAVYNNVIKEDDTGMFSEVIVLATICQEPGLYSNHFYHLLNLE